MANASEAAQRDTTLDRLIMRIEQQADACSSSDFTGRADWDMAANYLRRFRGLLLPLTSSADTTNRFEMVLNRAYLELRSIIAGVAADHDYDEQDDIFNLLSIVTGNLHRRRLADETKEELVDRG